MKFDTISSMKTQSIYIGLSGGVDSSVSAYLLKKQGYNVTALFMKNWDDIDCPSQQDYEDALRVANQLNIPLYTVNFVEEYYQEVFQDLLNGLKNGITPNPDILCNSKIKFRALYDKVKELGGDYLATGHYAQIHNENNQWFLKQALDTNKDQTYFLHAISPDILPYIKFPIGSLCKTEVRKIAHEQNLTTKNKKDSTGICFIGKRNFSQFIANYLKPKPGLFIDEHQNKIGIHQGLQFYTLGQRKGLNIGGPGDAWYVADKNITKNTVTLVQGKEHPMLFHRSVTTNHIHWLTHHPLPLQCHAKVRYRQKEQKCLVEQRDGFYHITFNEKQRAATPGQSIVFYHNNICIGGGIINQTTKNSIYI